ncbi:MAG: DUF3105 domain-containing protein [Chloroflexi bacterium]|nr:DUF3105 domain-containing protein [Chloroflexota bacterium]
MTKSSRQKQRKSGSTDPNKQQQYLILGGALAAAILLIGGVIYPMLQPRAPTSTGSAPCGNLQAMVDEGREHLKPGETPPAYKNNPPTSGTHNPEWYPAGIYDQNADLTRLIHSLEHGYVILYYNGIPKEQVDQLIRIQQSDPFKLIVAEYPNMPQKIAIVAWGNMQNCDGVNEQVIRSFIAQFRNHGPEQASMN